MNRMEEKSPNVYFNKPTIMEKPTFTESSSSEPSSTSTITIGGIDGKTMIIVLLIFFLLITVLGINVLTILGNVLQNLANFFGPVLSRFLNALGYSAGTALDKVSDVTAEVAKGGIDLADGALNDIGGLLKGTGPDPSLTPPPPANTPTQPPANIPTQPPANTPTQPPAEPSPDSSENNIQKPITSDKWSWCLVGEYQNKRGCIEITDTDKCMSGQVFPSQKMCLNPTWTP